MSDLFAPMPLPSRPLEQTADIAERDAAAQNREIDTRMRERLETGRQKMIHEFAVIKRDETERQYKAQLDKIYNLSIPTSLYNRGVSSLAKRYYQDRQAEDSRQLQQQEQGRLSSQQAAYDTRLNLVRNDLMLKVSQEGLSPEEALELWQEQLTEVANGTLSFNGDPNYSGYNLTAYKKANETAARETKSLTNSLYDNAQSMALSQMDNSFQTSITDAVSRFSSVQDVPDDVLGLNAKLEDVESWKEVERINEEVGPYTGQSVHDRGSRMWRLASDGIERRIANGALIEIMTRIKNEAMNAPEGTERSPIVDNVHRAMILVMDSPLFKDTQLRFDVNPEDIKKIIDVRLAPMLALLKSENQQALDQFNVKYMNGDLQDVSPESIYQELVSTGVPLAQARQRAIAHGTMQDNMPWLRDTQVRKQVEEDVTNGRVLLEKRFRQTMQNHPEFLGDPDEIRIDVQRLESVGQLSEGAWERLEPLLDESQRDLMGQYATVYQAKDDWLNTIAADRNAQQRYGTGFGSLYLPDSEGNRTESIAATDARLTAAIDSWIINGELDGESRLSPEGMTEKVRRMILTETNKLNLTRRTRDQVSGLTTVPSGEAVEMETFPIRALPGVGAASGRALVGHLGGQGTIDEMSVLPQDQQGAFAVRAIPLSSYDISEDDGVVHEQNVAELRALAREGYILRFAYIPEDKAFEIQLAENGQWHRRDLDSSAVAPVVKNLFEDTLRVEDIQMAIEDITSQGEGNLFYWHFDQVTGSRQAYPTAGGDALAASIQNLSITMLMLARLVRDHGYDVLQRIDMSSTGVAGGLRGR